ncbi:MAG: ANTAR domain-containing protein [Kineosporiaceae bacterium]
MPAPTAAPEVYPAPFDDAVAIQVERVETLLGAVRDIVSSLGATSAQLEREVAQALRPPQGGPGQGSAGQGSAGQPVESHTSGSAAADVAASAAALEAERAALLEAVEHRAVIEQAKGMLMLKHRCDADTAFGLLLEISRRERRKVRDIAADVVRAGTAPRPMVDLTGQGHRTAVASSGAGEMDARRSP